MRLMGVKRLADDDARALIWIGLSEAYQFADKPGNIAFSEENKS